MTKRFPLWGLGGIKYSQSARERGTRIRSMQAVPRVDSFLTDKFQAGEISQWRIVPSGKSQSKKYPLAKRPVREVSVGKMSVRDLSSEKCRPENCPLGKLSYNRLRLSACSTSSISFQENFIVLQLTHFENEINLNTQASHCKQT